VYYDEHAWPSKSAPLVSPKSDREIEHALASFPSDLKLRLSGQGADPLIQVSQIDRMTIEVVILSHRSESEVREAVIECMDRLHLFGDPLP
jgi:hypothetical protein